MLAADGKDALKFRRNIGKQHARAESTLSMIAFFLFLDIGPGDGMHLEIKSAVLDIEVQGD